MESLISYMDASGVLVIEDIDRFTPSFTVSADPGKADLFNRDPGGDPLTLGDVLNILDGVDTKEGLVVILTTNNLDKLDPALIRRGRVDRIVEFGPASHYQARTIFLRFFPGEEEAADEFATNVCSDPKRPVMADIQEHLIEHAENMQSAVEWNTKKPVLNCYEEVA
jgi:SpoVK/Ycf46/Vps4 family AAA+-type ATPase